MKIYAFIEDGKVSQLVMPFVNPEGVEVPIEERFTPEMVLFMVDVTENEPQPQPGWTYKNGVFAPYVIHAPTPEEILITQSAKLQSLTQLATAQKLALTNRIATLQDAINNVNVEGREEFAATAEEQVEFPKRKTQLSKWKDYAILLGRVTTQVGWPPEVVWPVQPVEGMDLTVSSVAPETV